ncbi:MAG: S1 RNA-binding domain-containing protein [Chitinivibrionales bacterium]|nr:S1 RNA-binding domain-containing protein [Chitinivibrionales bacterium]MBD3396425.1 S1 RNA-binding domain-containing protein [Chitinivibrionales bacterium]
MQDKNDDGFFEEKAAGRSPEEQLMAMIDSQDTETPEDFDIGARVSGTVLRVGKEYAFVDIGGKNEAMIAVGELSNKNGEVTVKEGDPVEGYVVSTENDETMLSQSLGGRKAGKSELTHAMKSGLPVQGKVTGVNKGGFNVNVMGHRAFCPLSHIDTTYVDDPNKYLSRSFPFAISRMTEGGRNIVVSRLPVLEQDLAARIDELSLAAQEQRVFTGTITRIVDFGLFVDLGGIEGLVHISEVSWERAHDLADTFSPGQTVECVVLKIDRRDSARDTKISLSMKHAQEDPWRGLPERLKPGEALDATVTRLVKFGAFVQVLPGIEGLVHISEMRWGGRVKHPSEVVSEGQQVRVTVLAVDEKKRSVSCTLKDVTDDPWQGVAQRFPAGSVATGTVASKTKYGYFVDLADGVTGLLVYGNIASDTKETLKPGDAVEVGIESVDMERRRISLTHGMPRAEPEAAQAKQRGPQQDGDDRGPSSEFAEKLRAALKGKNAQ